MEKGNSYLFEKVLIVIFSLLLLNQYRRHFTTSSEILEKNPQFELLKPSNTTIPPVDDDYRQLIGLKNFTFLINPPVCQNHTQGLLLLIIVSSNPVQIENRQFIRETWGKKTDFTKIVFLMGIPLKNDLEEDTLGDQVRKESLLYGDIVQGSFVDSYRNMTYKHLMGLKWAANHCPSAKYVLKTDDDVVVHSEALVNFLVRDLSPWGARKLILCDVSEHSPVFRHYTKWIVTMEEYANDYYPNYCRGYIILYSQDIVRDLVKASRKFNYFWIDDAMVTGIIAQSINIERTALKSLILSPQRAYVLKTMGPKYAGRFLFASSNLKKDKISEIWEARGVVDIAY